MLEPLRPVSTFVTPQLYATMRRVCAIEECSVYALAKRALVAYLVDWVRRNPDLADDVLRTS